MSPDVRAGPFPDSNSTREVFCLVFLLAMAGVVLVCVVSCRPSSLRRLAGTENTVTLGEMSELVGPILQTGGRIMNALLSQVPREWSRPFMYPLGDREGHSNLQILNLSLFGAGMFLVYTTDSGR